jgi:uncharacterized membrane protein
MVKVHTNKPEGFSQIILKPNASFSWAANLQLLYGLLIISLAIGFGFLYVGAWVILPFSIIELSVLTACIYYCVKRCNRQEVITIEEFAVSLQRGHKTPSEELSFHRLWSKFIVRPPRHPLDPSTVMLLSQGKEYEIGGFLSAKDKSQLIKVLKSLTYDHIAHRELDDDR